MNVSQVMKRNVKTCRPDETLAEAAGRMWDADIGCLPVVDGDGKAIGMVTDRDATMAAYTRGQPLFQIPVSVAMSKEAVCCLDTDGIIEAEEAMRSHQLRRLPVVDGDGRLVGILSLTDLAQEAEREMGRKGREVSAQEVTATLAAICEPRRSSSLIATT